MTITLNEACLDEIVINTFLLNPRPAGGLTRESFPFKKKKKSHGAFVFFLAKKIYLSVHN